MIRLYFFLVFILLSNSLFGQAFTEILLSSILTGNQQHIAFQTVLMLPGFSYSASGPNDSFFAKTDTTLQRITIVDVDYLDGTEIPDPENRILDLNKVVGTTSGVSSVNELGAFNYQIPLYSAPGTKGVQPSMSIIYSSQSGNGLLGWGWNLGGISSISRIPKPFYISENIQPINMIPSDEYAIDGNRLVLVSGTGIQGASGSIYRTEKETFTKITMYGTSGGGPSWLKSVNEKDSSTVEFGYGPHAYIENAQGTRLQWFITRYEDIHGNYIKFNYSKDITSGQVYLSSIQYTGNSITGLQPYNELQFEYERRTDKSIQYQGGIEIRNEALVKKIFSRCEGEIVRSYEFDYAFDEFSKLISLTESTDLQSYNSTIFKHGTESPTITRLSPLTKMGEHYFYFADYNGDGKSDYVLIPKKPANEYLPSDSIEYYQNLDGINFILKNKLPLSPPYFGEMNSYVHIPVQDEGNTLDVNGDGKAEFSTYLIIRYDNDHDGFLDTDGIFFPYYSINNQTGEMQYIWHDQVELGKTIITGDFNGDGVTDRIVATLGGSEYEVRLSGPSLIPYTSGNLNRNFTGMTSVADFNGDGKADLLLISNETIYVYDLNESQLNECMIPVDFTSNKFSLGDFNGDGKMDILGNDYIQLFISTGFSFQNILFEPQTPYYYDDLTFKLSDIDYDGRAEIIQEITIVDDWGLFQYYDKLFSAYHFNGESFVQEEIYSRSDAEEHSLSEFADFDGDGQADLYFRPFYDFEVSYSYIFQHKPDNKTKLLTRIADGLNNRIHITYEALPKSQSYETSGAIPLYPVVRIPIPTYLTVNVKNFNQGGTIPVGDVSYDYTNFLLQAKGRGILGFQKRVVQDAVSSIKKEFQYSYGTTFYNVYLANEKVFISNTPTSEVLNSLPSLHTFGNNCYFSYLSNSITENKLNDNRVEYSTSINSSGNLVTKSKTYKNSLGETEKLELEEYSNHNIFGSPQSVTKTSTKQTESIIRSQTIEYFPNTNLLKKIVSLYNNSPSIELSYTYDGFGNLLTETKSWNGQVRTSSRSYEPTKARFLITETNPLNMTTTYVLEAKYGNVVSATDHLDLTTTFEYNEFGSLITTIYPGGHSTTNTRYWSLGLENIGETYFDYIQASNSPSKKVFYGSDGRVFRKKTQIMDGRFTVIDITYDSNGRLLREYDPYFEGDNASKWVEYAYDNLGRVVARNKYPGNQSETTTYYDLENKVKKSIGGLDTYKEYNAYGLLWRATDPGGVITYLYNPEDQPSQISSPSGLTLVEYDSYGNRKKLTDLDAGIINTTYNGFGEMVQQVDHRGNTVSLEYDVLGRVVQKTWLGGETIVYSYDSNTGLLNGVSTPNYSSAYTYDSMFRLAQESETFDGALYTRSYLYNNKGDVTFSTINNSVIIENVYNSLGFTEDIKVNNQIVWSAGGMNSYGTIDEFDLGNQTSTQMSYGQFGLLESIVTTLGENNIQNWNYVFNQQTGNLTSREGLTSVGGMVTESFTYDMLNRLTTSTIGQNSTSITYDQNGLGNISSKSDVGNYDYTGGIHRVQGIENPSSYMQSLPQSTIEYTKFNKVSHISEIDIQNTNRELLINYGPNEERVKSSFLINNVLQYSKHYALGLYEKELNTSGTIRELYYINSPVGLVAILQRKNSQDSIFYIHKDHLGSFDVITRQNGSIKTRFNFDPWGRNRSPLDWSYNIIPSAAFDRGFTGHEHLYEFGLINMNGRLFDPVLGLFLSADNHIQLPDITHGYNRYGYCLNNPLIYTDPTGEFWHLIIGATIGGFVNWQTHGADLNWEGLGYFGVGAVAGALGAGVGLGVSSALAKESFFGGFMGTSTLVSTGFTSGFVSGAAGGFFGGFANGFGNAVMNPDKDFGDMLSAGWDSGWKGGLLGGAAGGITGGIDAVRHDRNFWTGSGKQGVVVKVNTQLNGEFKIIGEQDYNAPYTTQQTRDYHRTQLSGNGGITTASNGQITIKIPKNVNRITGIAAPDNTFFTNINIGRNALTLTPLDKTSYVILHGWRYHSNPVNSFKDLFYWRPRFF